MQQKAVFDYWSCVALAKPRRHQVAVFGLRARNAPVLLSLGSDRIFNVDIGRCARGVSDTDQWDNYNRARLCRNALTPTSRGIACYLTPSPLAYQGWIFCSEAFSFGGLRPSQKLQVGSHSGVANDFAWSLTTKAEHFSVPSDMRNTARYLECLHRVENALPECGSMEMDAGETLGNNK